MPQRTLLVLSLIGLLLGLASNSASAQGPSCAYVANNASNNVSAYVIDAATGKLGSVSGSPFAVVALPSSVAADPAGQSLYAANSVLSNSLWVSAFAIAPNCALTGRVDFPSSSSDFLQ